MFLNSNVSIDHLKSCLLDSVHLTKYMVNMARFFKAANNSEMYNATLKFLLNLSNETDDISDADLKIGSILMALGEYKEAITFLEAARATNSEELTIAKLLVDAYINIDERDKAIKNILIALNSTYMALYKKLTAILKNTSMAKLWTKTKKLMQFEREYNDYMQTFSDMFFTLDSFRGILAIDNLTGGFNKTIQLYEGNLTLEIQKARLYCLGNVLLDDKNYFKHQHSISEMMLSKDLLFTVDVQIMNFNILTQLQLSMGCSSRLKSCTPLPKDLVTLIVRTGRKQDKLFANVLSMANYVDIEIKTKKMEQRRNLILEGVKKSQFTLVNTLASVYYHFGNITEAKIYTQRASDLLPYMEIDKKIHFFIQYQLQLAYYEFLLGNLTGALELFKNCSLTINNEKLVLLPNAILYPKKEYGLSISSSGLASLKTYSLYKQMFDILKDSPSSKAEFEDAMISTLHMEYTVTMIIFILMLLLEISLIFITLEMHFFLYSVFSRFSYVAIGREMCVTYVRNCKFKPSNIQAWNYSFSRSKRIYSRNLCFIFMLTLPLLLIPAGLLTHGIQWYLEVWSSYYNVTQFNLTVTCMELLLS